jgi:hypothetical protein
MPNKQKIKRNLNKIARLEYLKMADHIVFSPAGANTNNYANGKFLQFDCDPTNDL